MKRQKFEKATLWAKKERAEELGGEEGGLVCGGEWAYLFLLSPLEATLCHR